MRIGMQSWGSQGDNRPMAALASRLAGAGHSVRLVVSDIQGRDYSPFLPVRGVRLVTTPVPRLSREQLDRIGAKALAMRDPLRQLSLVMKHLFDPLLPSITAEASALARWSDVVVGHFTVHPLAAAAEKAGVPHAAVVTTPILIPSGSCPAPGFPWMGETMNRMLWRAGSMLLNLLARNDVNGLRRRFGLPPVRDVLMGSILSRRLNLVGTSPALFPEPGDWDGSCRVCGWFGGDREASPLSFDAALSAFLDEGPPPLLVTAGSMMHVEPEPARWLAMVVEAVVSTGSRAVIQHGGRLPETVTRHRDIHFAGEADHFRVFPRCEGVIHHGGAGTTHTAAYCGRPSVVVAYGVDQGFWGGRLRELGLAAGPLSRRGLTAGRLATAIMEMKGSREMLAAAERTRALMHEEDGTGRAVELIEAL